MSRIRSIHPGLWTDEQFVSLSPYARLLFMGIWNECDDKGTFPWSPLQMKMRILPADNIDAGELMAELEAADCIRSYEIEGKKFGAVRNFARFQRPKSPNDIHPATAEILAYAGHSTESADDKTKSLPKRFPNASEKVPQREEGEEEEGEEVLSPDGDCASRDADAPDDAPNLKPEHVVDSWNKLATRLGKPVVRKLTPERRQRVKARIAGYSLEDWQEVIANVERSPFLRGETGWHGFSFDWMTKKANFQKILEGNYNG